MRTGMIGITSRYWPLAFARGLVKKGGKLAAFATLGDDDGIIRAHLGMTSREFMQKFGAKPYVDADEMMQSEELDTVILCTRHSEHAKWVENLAGYGVNMVVPKTFATTLADAEKMVRIAKKHKIKIAAGPSARYLPAMIAAKRAIDSGNIGRPFSMRLSHHHGVIDGFHETDWYRDKKEGGPELSLAWYVIDLVLFFLGKTVERVYAEYGNYASPDSPFMDCGKIVLRMANGAIASCDMYFCNRFSYPLWEMEILGPKGVVSIRQEGLDPAKAQVMLFTYKGGEILSVPTRTPDWEMFWVDDFCSNRQPSLGTEYASLVTRISLAARKSAQKKQLVKIQ